MWVPYLTLCWNGWEQVFGILTFTFFFSVKTFIDWLLDGLLSYLWAIHIKSNFIWKDVDLKKVLMEKVMKPSNQNVLNPWHVMAPAFHALKLWLLQEKEHLFRHKRNDVSVLSTPAPSKKFNSEMKFPFMPSKKVELLQYRRGSKLDKLYFLH